MKIDPIACALGCTLTLAACDAEHAAPREAVTAPATPTEAEAAEEAHVALTPTERDRIGLRLVTAGPVTLGLASQFPGEVVLVPDRVTHVVPQAPGIVRETIKTIGDRVEAGETLAVIESSVLAEAKLDFFSAAADIGCCEIALPRAREIFENVHRLVAVLDAGADPDAISALEEQDLGDWRGKLLGAQAELEAARAARERERSLRGRGVSTEKDLIEAEAAYRRARANLGALKDTARYATLVAFSDEARERQVAELTLVTATNRLRVLGVEEAWIERLSALIPSVSSFEPCTCTDPDCRDGEIPSIAQALDDGSELGRYALRAQQAGTVTEKHLSLGERISGEESAFVVVDTDRVWVRFNVYQKDLDLVREGAPAAVRLGEGAPERSGTIAFVSPVVDERTRTVEARIELENLDRRLRPGLFVTVDVEESGAAVAVAVPLDAVQVIDQEEVVFIEEEHGFVPVPVRTGRRDRRHVEVLEGVTAGIPVVVEGAFELKAEITTAGRGSHAGHGH